MRFRKYRAKRKNPISDAYAVQEHSFRLYRHMFGKRRDFLCFCLTARHSIAKGAILCRAVFFVFLFFY